MRVLFTGYAPVHFACFRPLFERLARTPGVELFVSGGIRQKTEDGYEYDEQAMYGPYDVPAAHVLSVGEMREQSFDLLFSGNTKLIEPRHVRKRIQIFHGISFRNKAVRPDNMSCDHYFVIGPYMHRRFIESGLLSRDDHRAVQIGFMKTDRLLDGTLTRESELRRLGLDGTRPVLLYAPTGQRHNSLETMGEDVIERLTASGRYDVLIKPHDHPKRKDVDWFARLGAYEDDHCRVLRDPDVIPLLFLADLLISDASSVTSEYSLLDRPMVFLDVPKLIARAGRAETSMLDLDTWGRRAGDIVENADAVLDTVDTAIENPTAHAETRQAMAADLLYNPGTATESAMAWLRELQWQHQDPHPLMAS